MYINVRVHISAYYKADDYEFSDGCFTMFFYTSVVIFHIYV